MLRIGADEGGASKGWAVAVHCANKLISVLIVFRRRYISDHACIGTSGARSAGVTRKCHLPRGLSSLYRSIFCIAEVAVADFKEALTSIQTDSTTAACESLLTLIDIAPSYAFTDSPNLLLTVQVIWQGLGARSTYVPHPRSLQQIRRVPVSSDRETASGLICSIIKRSAE